MFARSLTTVIVLSAVFLTTVVATGCSGIIGFNRQAERAAESTRQVWHLRPAIQNRNCYIDGGQRGLEINNDDFANILTQQLLQKQISIHDKPVDDIPLSQLLITQSCSPRDNPQENSESSGETAESDVDEVGQGIGSLISTITSPLIYRDLYVLDVEVWQEGEQLRAFHIEVPYQQFLSVWTGTVQALFMGDKRREEVNLKKGRALAREGIKRLVETLRQDPQLATLLSGESIESLESKMLDSIGDKSGS